MEVSGQLHAPATLPQGKSLHCIKRLPTFYQKMWYPHYCLPNEALHLYKQDFYLSQDDRDSRQVYKPHISIYTWKKLSSFEYDCHATTEQISQIKDYKWWLMSTLLSEDSDDSVHDPDYIQYKWYYLLSNEGGILFWGNCITHFGLSSFSIWLLGFLLNRYVMTKRVTDWHKDSCS
jgi:hypothetical protein